MNNIVLNATSITGCATVLMKDYGACGGNRNITVIATFEVVGGSNVIFHRNQPYITVSLNECKIIILLLLILDIQLLMNCNQQNSILIVHTILY